MDTTSQEYENENDRFFYLFILSILLFLHLFILLEQSKCLKS